MDYPGAPDVLTGSLEGEGEGRSQRDRLEDALLLGFF